MSLAEVIATRIQELCDERALTINKLATRSGVNQSTIASIMCGKVKSPKLETLMRIAIGLNLTITEFLDIPDIIMFNFDEPDCFGD